VCVRLKDGGREVGGGERWHGIVGVMVHGDQRVLVCETESVYVY
jgi:hypothetical protein